MALVRSSHRWANVATLPLRTWGVAHPLFRKRVRPTGGDHRTAIAAILFWCLASLGLAQERSEKDATASANSRRNAPWLETYAAKDATYFALAIADEVEGDLPQPGPFPSEEAGRAVDLAVVVDLSASQAGPAFKQTVEITRQVIAGLTGGSRVQMWPAHRPSGAWMAKPAAVGSRALNDALEKLAGTSPLGATNLPAVFEGVEAWLDDTNGDLPKRILVVGDGRSTAQPWDDTKLEPLVGKLVERRASLHFVAVGDSASPALLTSIAVRTGGIARRLAEDIHHEAIAIRESLVQPALFVTNIEIEPRHALLLPTTLPPLRTETATLVAGKWTPAEEMTVKITGERDGQTVKHVWRVKPATGGMEPRFLVDLVERWSAKPDWPAMHDARTTLDRAQSLVATQTEAYAAQAQAALAERRLDDADAFYRIVLAWEPDSLEAVVGLRAIQSLKQAKDSRPALRPPVRELSSPVKPAKASRRPVTEDPAPSPAGDTPSTEPSTDPIAQAKSREAIQKQKMTLEVTQALGDSRRTARKDIQAAIGLLKRSIEALDASEIDDDARARLRQRLESQLRIFSREQHRTHVEELQRTAALARSDRRKAETQVQLTRQEQERQLLEQYRALMAAGNYAQAERVAEEAVASDPKLPAANASLLEAQLADRYDRIEELEWAKQKGWWETLYASEQSSIPISDTIPVIFPPAKEWEEKTLKRAKYKAVDLAPVSEAEEEIRKALTQPISFNFQDTPLSDVIDFLKDFAGINVVIDVEGLADAGIEASEPITLQLDNVPLKSALKLAIRPLGLAYIIRDDVLLITSQETADTTLITKVYPVADLVIPIQNFNQGGLGVGGFQGPNSQPGGQGLQGLAPGGGGFGGFGGAAREVRQVGDDLIEMIQETIGDTSNASPAKVEGIMAARWDRHFAGHQETDRSLEGAVAMLVEAGRHDAVVAMLKAAFRHQTSNTWLLEAFALSAQLYGLDADETASAILSTVDAQPDDLALRLSAAAALAQAGQGKKAVSFLLGTAKANPGSVNTYYLTLELAARLGDVDAAAWAADELLRREWPAVEPSVHDRTRDLVQRTQSALRSEGRAIDADRLAAVAAASRQRDIEITLQWEGDADLDLTVIEPGETFCSALTPRTVGGGVLVCDDVNNVERYVASEAFSGTYEIRVRPIWGQPTAGLATVDIVQNKGTAEETRERRTWKLREANEPIKVELARGRRTEATAIGADERLFVAQPGPAKGSPRGQLHRMIQSGRIDADPNPPAVGFGGPGAFAGGRSVPFVVGGIGAVGGGAVAFDPVIEVLQDGISLQAQAVVSADRRYVRMTLVPLIQNIQAIEDVRTIDVGGTAR